MLPNDPDEYKDWHLMPADRRDRAVVLAIARRRGVVPRWAERGLTRVDRIVRLERVLEAFAARLVTQEDA